MLCCSFAFQEECALPMGTMRAGFGLYHKIRRDVRGNLKRAFCPPRRRCAIALSVTGRLRTLCQLLLRLADFCGALWCALAKPGAQLRVAVTQIGVAHAVRLQIWTAAPAPARLFLPLAAPRLRSHSQLPASAAGSGRRSRPGAKRAEKIGSKEKKAKTKK